MFKKADRLIFSDGEIEAHLSIGLMIAMLETHPNWVKVLEDEVKDITRQLSSHDMRMILARSINCKDTTLLELVQLQLKKKEDRHERAT